ncbi:hypothetical protein RDI58_007402 [Solanum bulbocastanum]|uniref:Uncharacterized protein n=1 Tax=Solanum bulbocastanum TaxID=147425 RepID=A0AAN8TUX6_SOLBU
MGRHKGGGGELLNYLGHLQPNPLFYSPNIEFSIFSDNQLQPNSLFYSLKRNLFLSPQYYIIISISFLFSYFIL